MRDWLMSATDYTREHRLPLAIAACAALVAFLLGRRGAEPARVADPAMNGSPPAEPAMEVATAVELSRPQPAELDEIVPAAGATT